MEDSMFSFKEFEDVRLKATYNIEIGDRTIVPGETIVKFDKIAIAGLSEIVNRVSARGGYGNRSWVFWETTKEQRISFAQGVFSKEQLALLGNSKLIELKQNQYLSLTEREIVESNENGVVTLKKVPNDLNLVFVYNANTGEKISNFTLNENAITITTSFLDVIVDYTYDYTNGVKLFEIGRKFLNGFVELEGKTRIKDDTNGSVITGLIRVPRLKLMSDLSIMLGTQASPVVANFTAVGVPVGSRETARVCEFFFLSDDIDSDL